MIAIFKQRNVYYGHKMDISQEEADGLTVEHILVESLPEALLFIPPNHYATIDEDLNVTYAEIPPPAPEPDRVAQLESESAMLALELIDTQIRLDQSENDQAALLLELIDKGVL